MRSYSKTLYNEFINGQYMEKDKFPIRIMSDLHIDYNHKYPLKLDKNDILTILAGDISGYPNIGIEWIRQNITNGIYIGGNHILYNDLNKSLQELYDLYQKEFPINSNISFLQNDYKIIDNIVFVGATLWTNGRLNGFNNAYNIYKYLNDYHIGLYTDDNGVNRPFTPENSFYEFDKSLKFINEICNKFSRYKVVVITHHCPIKDCVYRFNPCPEGYASNLESFIRDHGNIVAWICGHTHIQDEFDIDGCKVILNCRGYVEHGDAEKFNANKIVYI